MFGSSQEYRQFVQDYLLTRKLPDRLKYLDSD